MQDHTVALDRDDMRRTLVRIAHEIVEKNPPQSAEGEHVLTISETNPGLAIVGIQRRGAILAQRLHQLTSELTRTEIPFGSVDISFYRDDLGLRTGSAAPVVHSTELNFAIDGRTIVIVDDVLYTGRTARSAIDVLFDYGRPARVQLAVLVDRGHRELPIRADFVGKNLPTAADEKIRVRLAEVDDTEFVEIIGGAA
jgi:pyrimidine operon attenuation protein / uracil phosphoribosyltransferase